MSYITFPLNRSEVIPQDENKEEHRTPPHSIPSFVPIQQSTQPIFSSRVVKLSLIEAAKKGDLETVKTHLSMNTSLDATDSKGDTALINACCYGHFNIVQLLVQQDAQLDLANREGYTALSMAAQENHDQIVRFLVEQNADIHLKDNMNWTPLHWLASLENLDLCKFLVSKGAVPDAFCLFLASKSTNQSLVNYLRETFSEN